MLFRSARSVADDEIKKQVGYHTATLKLSLPPATPFSDTSVAKLSVMRDYLWLVQEPAGRENRSGDTRSEYGDPFLSHTIHYGILANTTRNPVFDAMYRRVGGAILQNYCQNSPETLELYSTGDREVLDGQKVHKTFNEYLNSVVAVYGAHHPEQVDTIEETLNRSVT